MPHRDPETGKFVSDGEMDDFNDLRAVSFEYSARIPAADLSGQTVEEVRDDTVADMEEIIDDDEMFEIVTVDLVYSFYFSVTSSGEMSATLYGFLGADDIDRGGHADPAATGTASTAGQDNLVDVAQSEVRTDRAIVAMAGSADNGESDSTNALGRGGAENVGTHIHTAPAMEYDGGPLLDSTDEIVADYQIFTDQAANVGINFDVVGVIQGRIHEV